MKLTKYSYPLSLSALVVTALVGCSAGDDYADIHSTDDEQELALATYTFGSNGGAGKCMDVAGWGTHDGANIVSWACHGGNNQKFRVESLGGDLYRLVSVHSGKCVDVAAAGTSDGTNIHQWTCNGTGAQAFRIEDLSNGNVRMVNTNSNKCIDVAGGSNADGANVHLWSCSSFIAQVFKPVNSGTTQPPPSTCNYPNWQQGTAYRPGNIVKFTDGRYYIAEHDNPGYDPTISTWFWDPYNCSGSNPPPLPPPPPPPPQGSGLASILSESMFNSMFPSRNGFYTYQGLINGAAFYSAFAGTGDTTARKREVAAFLANTAHETGNLWYVEEIAKGEYCASSGDCPCAPGKRYFGRGPIQLSWNYNYCAAGRALGLDLRADPDLVARDAKVAWQTGLWFWMTSSGAGYRPAHDSISNGFGFGETIRTINGSLECNGGNPGQVQSRIDKYRDFCAKLGVDPGPNLGC